MKIRPRSPILMKPVKISLIGTGGTGKTTIRKALQGLPIDPEERSPTVGVDVAKIDVNGRPAALWDLGGQERFRFLWDSFTLGTDLAVFVTDSTEENVALTERLVETFRRTMSAKVIALANKQDLPGAMAPSEVQDRLGVPTFGTVAVDQNRADELVSILARHAHKD